ncbi:MAG: hypothetical protein AB1Z65_02520 [Candidatus Sulfomarinibacteraceae bacterium]
MSFHRKGFPGAHRFVLLAPDIKQHVTLSTAAPPRGAYVWDDDA